MQMKAERAKPGPLAAVFATLLLLAGPAAAEEITDPDPSAGLADIRATARESCETGIGSLDGSIEAAEGVEEAERQKAREELAEARRAFEAGDYGACFSHLEAGLALIGRDVMQVVDEGDPGPSD